MTAARSSPTTLAGIVAAHVRRLRRAQGWTQSNTAARLADAGMVMGHTCLSKLESGERTVTVDELAILAAVFDIADPWSLTVLPECATCHGAPPAGFTCNDCGAVGVR